LIPNALETESRFRAQALFSFFRLHANKPKLDFLQAAVGSTTDDRGKQKQEKIQTSDEEGQSYLNSTIGQPLLWFQHSMVHCIANEEKFLGGYAHKYTLCYILVFVKLENTL
jgi:hypothetical protein